MALPNPFGELYKACNTGDPADKWENLPKFPRIIDIEPVSVCNMRCAMCPTGLHALGRPQGMMDWGIYMMILAEVYKSGGSAFRFIGWGEPLMHPDIVNMITLATNHGIMTHINTNGLLFDEAMAHKLLIAGLVSIKFSFQGVDSIGYLNMRKSDSFHALIDKIEMLHRMRGDDPIPFISVSTSVTNEAQSDIDTFTSYLSRYTDEVNVGHTTFDYIDQEKIPEKSRAAVEKAARHQNLIKKHPDPCPEVYDKLSIHHNGDVMVCCNAYSDDEGKIGNIRENSLEDLWRGKVMEEYRERLAHKEYSGPLCSVCYDYMNCTEGKR